MFCSSRGKNLFCSGGEGREEVDNDDDAGNLPMRMNRMEEMARNDDDIDAHKGRGIIDELVVNALKNLTFEDRQRYINEQHGVQDNFEESSPDFLTHKLHELEAELNIQLRQKIEGSILWPAPSESLPPGILIANSLDPSFVQNTYRLRLRVLRAEFFNAAKAAARMIRYFDLKRDVFGVERICKNITFDDLNSDDVDALNKGFLQYMQGRDSVGRRIFVLFPSIIELKDPNSLPRLFFFYDSFINTNEFDKGYVFLAFHIGPPSKHAHDMQIRMLRLKESLIGYPDSPSAIHACFYPNYREVYLTKVVLSFMPSDVRAKIKVHVGSHVEWLYELMSYGIGQHLVPISSSGEIKFKQHQAYIEYRRKLEDRCAVDPSYYAIELPNNDDVLFVRGRPFQQHRANVRLLYWIDENAARYDSCKTSKEKTKVILDVVKDVKSYQGARLLIQDRSLLWKEADDSTIKEKLAQMFRNVRKSVAASTATATTTSKTTTPKNLSSRRMNSNPSSTKYNTDVDCAVGKQTADNDKEEKICNTPLDNNENSNVSTKRQRLHKFAGLPFYDTNEDTV